MASNSELFLKFFQVRNGVLTDVDNYPKAQIYQCVDLVRKYCTEGLGLPVGTLAPGNAADIFLKFPNIAGSQYFAKITNRPWNYPQQGDIVVFGAPYGRDIVNNKVIYYGHIGIVNTANVWKMTVFSQNLGKDIAPRLTECNYNGVLGWLRPNIRTT